MNRIPGCGFAGVKEKHQGDMEARGTLALVFGSLKSKGGSGNRNMFYFRKICVKQTRTRILQSRSLHEEVIKLRHLLYSSSHHAGSLQRWPPLILSPNQIEFALLFFLLYSPAVYLWLWPASPQLRSGFQPSQMCQRWRRRLAPTRPTFHKMRPLFDWFVPKLVLLHHSLSDGHFLRLDTTMMHSQR